MIVLDPPMDYHGKFKGCSHMVSDKPGPEGTAELLAFARRIGMQAEWIQHPGTWKEHFDVFGSRRPRAVSAGAKEIGRRQIVSIWRAKRRLPPTPPTPSQPAPRPARPPGPAP